MSSLWVSLGIFFVIFDCRFSSSLLEQQFGKKSRKMIAKLQNGQHFRLVRLNYLASHRRWSMISSHTMTEEKYHPITSREKDI